MIVKSPKAQKLWNPRTGIPCAWPKTGEDCGLAGTLVSHARREIQFSDRRGLCIAADKAMEYNGAVLTSPACANDRNPRPITLAVKLEQPIPKMASTWMACNKSDRGQDVRKQIFGTRKVESYHCQGTSPAGYRE
jgi:hypothetical protein